MLLFILNLKFLFEAKNASDGVSTREPVETDEKVPHV